MDYWAKPKVPRHQLLLFHPTLEATISQDHSARLFEETLALMDWSQWEACYHGRLGQPPIHPRVVAGVLLYGYSMGLRSSRKLEWACTACLDFLWLAEGRAIDHATFCQFRTKFRKPLAALFGQVGRVAMRLGLITLNQVGLDGTRVQADSSRHETRGVESLEKKLARLDAQIETILAEAEAADTKENDLFGEQTPHTLPRPLSDARRRRERLKQALAAATGGKEGAKVPVADPESSILPNKDGGFAPNYTPMAAVDGERGYVVDCDVHAEAGEAQTTIPTVERIAETFGANPKQFLADAGHATGPNLAALAQKGIDGYVPLGAEAEPTDNPAQRADPRQAVSAADWPRLPHNEKGTLTKAAFVYDERQDVYYCPMGRRLEYTQQSRQKREGREVHYRHYQCVGCGDCPLAERCRRGPEARTVSHDEYEGHRRAMRAKLKSPQGRSVYGCRAWVCETPWAFMKGVMRLRRFLLRGLEKVKTEWCWACTAYNLRKLARDLASLRSQSVQRMG